MFKSSATLCGNMDSGKQTHSLMQRWRCGNIHSVKSFRFDRGHLFWVAFSSSPGKLLILKTGNTLYDAVWRWLFLSTLRRKRNIPKRGKKWPFSPFSQLPTSASCFDRALASASWVNSYTYTRHNLYTYIIIIIIYTEFLNIFRNAVMISVWRLISISWV